MRIGRLNDDPLTLVLEAVPDRVLTSFVCCAEPWDAGRVTPTRADKEACEAHEALSQGPMRQRALELIARHEGRWSFYQLDWAMTAGGVTDMPGGWSIGRLLDALEDEGLIVGAEQADTGAVLYSLTEVGRAALRQPVS